MKPHQSLFLASAILIVAGCRDLDYPTGDNTNAPPDVSFVSPAEGELVSLAPIIQVEALDPNGIADVTLYCEGVPVFVWTAPPFLGNVDLSHCPGQDDGNGVRTVSLMLTAHDNLGMATINPVTRSLRLDASVAQLRVVMPTRATPGGALQARITSDKRLGAVPTARIGSLTAQVTERKDLEPTGSELTVFDAVFFPLPGLGTDLYDGGTQDVPIEVLEQVDQTQLVEIEGHATSGNVTRAVIQITVSRVAWDRGTPGLYVPPSGAYPGGFARAAMPVATDGGLVLPAQFAQGAWYPQYYAHDTGAFAAFSRTDLTRDGGFAPTAVDEEGRTELQRGSGGAAAAYQYTYVAGPTAPETPLVATDNFQGSDRLRVNGALCAEENQDGGACDGTMGRRLLCSSPAGDVSTPFANNPRDLGGPTPTYSVVSGDLYWGAVYSGGCGDPNVVVRAAPGLGAQVLMPVTPPEYIVGLIPFGNGSVAISLFDGAGVSRTHRIARDGTVGPSFFSDAAVTALGLPVAGGVPPSMILAGRQDGALVTLRYDAPYTVFEAWTEGAATPLGSFRLPGYYVGSGNAGVPEDVVADADNSLAILLVATDPSTGFKAGPVLAQKATGEDYLLRVDPQFRPRWLWRAGSNYGRLYANRTGSHLYYVDDAWGWITALAR